MKKYLLIVLLHLISSISATTQVLTDFYDYTLLSDGTYRISLTDNFRAQLDQTSDGIFTSGYYTWHTGDALPNPCPNGEYEGTKVTDMSSLFASLNYLTSLDLSNFDTSNVTNMSSMFDTAGALTSIDLSSFNTSNVTSMSAMFRYCCSVNSLNLSNFDTSNVTDMSSMFEYCGAVSLNLSNFDTSNVYNMLLMFCNCSIVSLDLSSFTTSSETNLNFMFSDCTSLKFLDISSFDSSSENSYTRSGMFYNCGVQSYMGPQSIVKVKNNRAVETYSDDMTNADLTKLSFVVNQEKYDNDHFLEDFYVYTLLSDGTYKVSPTNIFRNELAKESGSVFQAGNYTWHTGDPLPNPAPDGKYMGLKVSDMSYMFYEYSAPSLDLSNFDTSNVTSMYGMFSQCGATSINLSGFDTSNVTDMSYMFHLCGATSLDLSSFKSSIGCNTTMMFCECSNLTSLDMSNFKTIYSVDGYINSMFLNCTSLKFIDISSLDTDNIDCVGGMFDNCGVSYNGAPQTIVVVKDNNAIDKFSTDASIDLTKIKFVTKDDYYHSTDGDVNGDGVVDVTDVNMVINIILTDGSNDAADVNDDGVIDVTDVNAIINIILVK